MYKRFKTALLLFFLGFIIWPCFADKILMGVSFSIPPYVIKENDTGIELEILREAFKVKGHTIDVQYLPHARTFLHIKSGKVDGIINTKEGMVEGVFYSDVVITFQNCAISLAKKKYPDLYNLTFLKDKYIVAFQKASVVFGHEFAKIVNANKKYHETANQKTQLSRLFMERDADFIIMEKNIFRYFRKTEKSAIANTYKLPVTFHYIFPPTNYKFAFSDKKIRDDFNLGLKTIKSNGVYERIIKKYEQLMELSQ